ncbi:hypothetical protein SUGI_0447080 [Cryptomeria japonica]|uniref:serine/threonine-protein kinase OXI1 n=1 Tax=Cryptomeria japonica TaxID=3369 RepID=UPI002408ED40|nr:serine/threonine-protein kinase OXI1 [Cryptomeria japonica]GLJ23608.1 hypothetical protein SUGI_0447080 [Cryptomeria japonica]
MGEGRTAERSKMEMDELKAVKVVGRGAMGTVFLVKKQGCEKPLALKAMSKSAMAKKGDGLRRAQIEKDILSRLDHPFLPALIGHVETEKMMGWLVDYCPGGDLNALRHRQTEKMFSESIIRFYAAEIVLALEHLHSLGIVYRDLKPENVLIQANGHIMLTDFDLSTRLSPRPQEQENDKPESPEEMPSKRRPSGRLDSVVSYLKRAASTKTSAGKVARSNSARVSPVVKKTKPPNDEGVASPSGRLNSFVGTEEYVSPEVVRGTGHEFGVDWWALGVLLYEMSYGKTPFKGTNRKETFYNILVREPQLMGPSTPFSDLIRRLLNKEPRYRLGVRNGADEIKSHTFFSGLNWQAVQHVSRAPFVPPAAAALHANGSHVNIEDCVEKLQMELAAAKLSSHSRSHDYQEAPQNWVERLSRSRGGNAFGVF